MFPLFRRSEFPALLVSFEPCSAWCWSLIWLGRARMSEELDWRTMTVALTGLMWSPYILDRIMVRGVMGAMANPSPTDKPQSVWAQRMMAAHVNAVENLVVFAPLVLVAQALNIHTAATAFACALYF